MKPLTLVMTLALLIIIGLLFIAQLLFYGQGHISIVQILLMLVGAIATGILLFLLLFGLCALCYTVWCELRPKRSGDLKPK